MKNSMFDNEEKTKASFAFRYIDMHVVYISLNLIFFRDTRNFFLDIPSLSGLSKQISSQKTSKREEKIINAISSTNGNFTVRDLKR